jgi:hypothetical protein
MSREHSKGSVYEVFPTRSNTVTRFPTGLMIELPSGVNTRLPWLYTNPCKFENCSGVVYVVEDMRVSVEVAEKRTTTATWW